MNQNCLDQYHADCDTALEWIARLRAETVSDQDREAFALWLASHSRHRQAMDSMLELWEDLGALKHLPDIPMQPAANDRNWWLGAAAVAATVVFALLLLPATTTQDITLEYQTAFGQRLSVELPDNSNLTLNTDSLARVHYDDAQRYIELVRGEAYFDVVKDQQRPFHVDTDSARVTALGTAFNIRRDGEASAITVTEGVVRVTEINAPSTRAAANEVLHAGQQLTSDDRGFSSSSLPGLDAVTAWQQGKLIAEGITLKALVSELARYHRQPIFLGSRDLAALSVSGVFELDQLGSTLQALELSLNLQAVELDSGAIQLLKSPE
jgi:transmembrane sensor